MCRLFPCIPIFRGVFCLKSVKKCVRVVGLKIALLFVKNVREGVSELWAVGSCKTYYLCI